MTVVTTSVAVPRASSAPARASRSAVLSALCAEVWAASAEVPRTGAGYQTERTSLPWVVRRPTPAANRAVMRPSLPGLTPPVGWRHDLHALLRRPGRGGPAGRLRRSRRTDRPAVRPALRLR